MADPIIKKYRIQQKDTDGNIITLHPETEAVITQVKKGEDAYKGNAKNVQAALEELDQRIDDVEAGTEADLTKYVKKDLSILPDVSTNTENAQLSIFTNDTGEPSKITLSTLQDRIIKTVNTNEDKADLKLGQYMFTKI